MAGLTVMQLNSNDWADNRHYPYHTAGLTFDIPSLMARPTLLSLIFNTLAHHAITHLRWLAWQWVNHSVTHFTSLGQQWHYHGLTCLRWLGQHSLSIISPPIPDVVLQLHWLIIRWTIDHIPLFLRVPNLFPVFLPLCLIPFSISISPTIHYWHQEKVFELL
jgi:hypothetical protein